MRLAILLCLALAGCVARTTLGTEPDLANTDAGMSSSADASAQGSPDAGSGAEDATTRAFERELLGIWQGTLAIGAWKPPLTIAFKRNSVYAICDQALECRDTGRFFVTDRTSNGHFAGELQNSGMVRTSRMDDMWIDYQRPAKVLRFALDNDLWLSGTAELTRLPD